MVQEGFLEEEVFLGLLEPGEASSSPFSPTSIKDTDYGKDWGFFSFHGEPKVYLGCPPCGSLPPTTSLPCPHQLQTSPMLSKALIRAPVPHKTLFTCLSRAPWADPSSLAHPHQQWGPVQRGHCQVKQPCRNPGLG